MQNSMYVYVKHLQGCKAKVNNNTHDNSKKAALGEIQTNDTAV